MNNDVPCPPSDALGLLLQGRLEGPDAERWLVHLDSCSTCLHLARRLAFDDPLVEALRRQKEPALLPLPDAPDSSRDRTLSLRPSLLPSASAHPDPLPGFVLLGEIGRGGMGIVERARQLRPNRLVAIKRIRAGASADPTQRARFRAEADAVAALQHPHIVALFEVGVHHDQPFLVMELVDGSGLDRRLEAGPLDSSEAARLVEVLARAMHHAHQRGVVHRDLKPSNVLLTADGTPKLTDFGLARRLDSDAALTASEAVLGTPSYMAPEQAAGSKDVGPACDVYALGAVLYECLVGRPPFRAATPLETARQVLEEEPVSPARLQPGVPADLETVGLKCLQKDPARRYASADDLADDLARFLRHEPIRARRASALERARKWARRRPAAAALGLLALFAGLALLTGSIWHTLTVAAERRKVAQREQALQEQTAEVDRHRRKVAEQQRQVAQHTYALEMRRALDCWNDGDVSAARTLLARHVPAPGGDDRRGFEWYYLDRLCRDAGRRTLTTHAGGVLSLALAPDGNTLATAGRDGSVHLRDLATSRQQALLGPARHSTEHLLFSSDGRLLALQRQAVRAWPLLGGPEHRISIPSPGNVLRVAASPSGTSLGVIRPDGMFELYALPSCRKISTRRVADRGKAHAIHCLAIGDDGKHLILAPGSGLVIVELATGISRPHPFLAGPARTAVVSPDCRTTAVVDGSGTVLLVDLFSGADRLVLPASRTGKARCAAFAPAEGLLATGSDDHTVRLWDLSSGALLAVFKGHTEAVNSVAFSPDGRSLFSAGEEGAVLRWQVEECQERRALAGSLRPAGPMASSDDGKTLLLAQVNGPLALLDTLTGRTRLVGSGPLGAVRALALSPDGRLAATAGTGSAIRLWDVGAGKVLRTFDHRAPVGALTFCPQGLGLVSAGPDSLVRFWDLRAGRECSPLPAPPRDVRVLSFSPDGKTLATSSGKATFTLWDLASGKEGPSFREKTDVTALVWSRDGKSLATGCRSEVVSIRRRDGGKWSAPELHRAGERLLGFVPDDATLAIASRHGASLYDRTTRSRHSLLACPLEGAACGPRGNSLVLLRSGGALTVWHPGSQERLFPLGLRLAPVQALAFSRDGKLVVTGSHEEDLHITTWVPWSALGARGKAQFIRLAPGPCPEMRFWCARTGGEQSTFARQETLGAAHLAICPDGRTLVSAGRGGVLWEWDLVGRRLKRPAFINADARKYWEFWESSRTFPGLAPQFPVAVQVLAVSPDGRRLAAGSSRGEVSLWDLPAGRFLLSLPERHAQLSCLAFAPDGRTLAVNDDRAVRLWQLPAETGEGVRLLATLNGHSRGVRCLAFDPAGRTLASAGLDRRVILWDLPTGRPLLLSGHHDTIDALAISPDGRTVASGGADGKLLLWHLPTGSELFALQGHRGPVRCLAFAPDGRTLASGGVSAPGSGEAYLWQGSSRSNPAARDE